MKKILVFMLCAVLLCTMPIVAFAEETVPAEGEVVTESAPEETVTEMIVDYVQDHFEEISVVVSLMLMAFYDRITRRKLGSTIGTLNNNAITVAEKSKDAIDVALSKVADLATIVQNYENKMGTLIDEIRKSEEEKKALGGDGGGGGSVV